MNLFKLLFKTEKNISKPDFIYIRLDNKITKVNLITNTTSGPYSVSDFSSHSESSKQEVANKNSINFWDRLFGTKKYQEFSKSVKGFYNEDKVWKYLSKKYLTVFSRELDHLGVDILLSKDGKNYFGFQIKSSDYYADHFRQTDKYKNVHGLIIVGREFDGNNIASQVKKIVDIYNFS